MSREFDLERAARNQLSSFVYDISSVTDLGFLQVLSCPTWVSGMKHICIASVQFCVRNAYIALCGFVCVTVVHVITCSGSGHRFVTCPETVQRFVLEV